MAITLPSTPAVETIRQRYRSGRKIYTSPLTGSSQVNKRPADRWSLEAITPAMRGDDARLWISRLVQGAGDTVRAVWPQVDMATGSPGSPTVNGSGLAGSTLPVTGAAAGYVVKEGQMLSFLNSSSRYELKMCTANTTLVAGAGSIPIMPAIRKSPSSGAAVLLSNPIFEGILVDDAQEWEWTGDKPYSFTVRFDGVE